MLLRAVRLVQAAPRDLKGSDQGRIVFIASVSVRQPIPHIALSNSMRAAVTGLAKTLARELAPDRITVNCLAPDAILTDRIRHLAAAAGVDPEGRVKQQTAPPAAGPVGEPAGVPAPGAVHR